MRRQSAIGCSCIWTRIHEGYEGEGSVQVVLTEEREGEYNGRAGAYYGIWLMAVAVFDVLIGEGAPQY